MPPSATGLRPGYQVTISDGSNIVGVMAHTADTPSPRAIRRLPQGPGVERKSIVQNTFMGGRGGYRLASDSTKFYDSQSAWTMVDGYAISGPLARQVTGRLGHEYHGDQPGGTFASGLTSGVDYFPINVTNSRLARKVTLPAMQPEDLAVIVRRVGTPAGPLYLELWTNGAGLPGAKIADALTITIAVGDPAVSAVAGWYIGWVGLPILAGGDYWVVVRDPTAPAVGDPHWEVGVHFDAGAEPDGYGWNGAAWANIHQALYWSACVDDWWDHSRYRFFEYQRQLYCATAPDDGSAAKLYMNGFRGVGNVPIPISSTGLLNDLDAGWSVDQWVGCVVFILSGPLKHKWGVISHNTATQLQFTPYIPSAGADVDYVILGAESWVEIGATGLTAPVTSVQVMNGIVYFAQGNGVNIRRMREYNNAGVWTREFADDGANRADFLQTFTDESGVLRMYRGKNDDVTFSKADKQAWGANLTFDASQPAGDTETFITGMTVYDNQIYIGKEDAIGLIKNGLWSAVPIGMHVARDEHNGQGLVAWNTNLYFPFLNGLERLYGAVVDDVGPDRGEGMDASRRGRVSDFRPILQYGYGAINAGSGAGLSSIMATTSPGGDWHELYRARGPGRQICDLFYQSIPGVCNRLWFSESNGIGYLHLPRDAHSPLNDPNMRYCDQSVVVTSWIDGDSADLDHFWNELRLYTRNLGAFGGGRIEVDYQADDDNDWTAFPASGVFATSPHQIKPVGDGTVTGRRVRFRLRLHTINTDTPVIVNALDVRVDVMHEVLYDYVLDFQSKDRLMLLSGKDSRTRSIAALAQLEAWQEDATVLTWRCVIPAFDNLRGHIDPVSLVPRSWRKNNTELIGSLTFKQTS